MFISGHNRWSSNTVLKSQWSWHWARNLIWIVCRGEGFLDVSVVAMRVFFSNRYMPFWMWTGEQWRANTDFWTFSKHEAKVIYFLYIYWSNECHFKRPIQSVLNHWGLAILYSILTELQIIIYICILYYNNYITYTHTVLLCLCSLVQLFLYLFVRWKLKRNRQGPCRVPCRDFCQKLHQSTWRRRVVFWHLAGYW